MKPKPLICKIELMLFLCALASQAWGSMVVISVDGTNMREMPFVIRTDRSGNAMHDKSINFYVIAAPRNRQHFSLGGASLSIYDGTNFGSSALISSCNVAQGKVPQFMQDLKTPVVTNGVFYSFEVSTNHLDSVKFEISYVSDHIPAEINYRFALPSLVHPSLKTERSRGTNDRTP